MTTVSAVGRADRHKRSAASVAGLTAVALLLGACGTSGGRSGSDGELTVVASTGVWGGIARTVGGPDVSVRSIISNNEADPHSYESTPRDAAMVGDADLIVYNGGGYDPFVPQILDSAAGKAPAVQAVEVANAGHETHARSGGKHGHEEGHSTHSPGSHGHGGHGHGGHGHGGHGHASNEHVWYRPSSVGRVASRVADELARLRPQHAADFRRRAADLRHRIDGLEQRIAELEKQHGGTEVLTTAPVSDLLLDEAGLVDVTPPEFVQAVESGSDPAAATIATMQRAVDSGRASVMIYNPQTASPLTERLRTRAERNGMPVVVMSETPPRGETYVEWMGGQIAALDKALGTP